MKKTKFCVALGYSGKIIKKTVISWQILDKKFNVKYVRDNNCIPHITLLSGDVYLNKQNTIYEILKKFKFKKFKLKSPGLGIFANKKPNLYIRWEKDKKLITLREFFKKKFLNTLW